MSLSTSGIAAGTYYIGVIADYSNAVSETDDTNNATNGLQIIITAPVGAHIPAHDFNGDGVSDMLFRNNTTGDTGFYQLNNNGALHGRMMLLAMAERRLGLADKVARVFLDQCSRRGSCTALSTCSALPCSRSAPTTRTPTTSIICGPIPHSSWSADIAAQIQQRVQLDRGLR